MSNDKWRVVTVERLRLVVLLLVVCLPATLTAQSNRTLDSLLGALNDSNWETRANAVEQLSQDTEMWSASATRRALVALLVRENKTIRDRTLAVRSEQEGEAFAQYYSQLLTRVDSLVDPSDASSISVLVESAYNPDSPLALKLASYGQPVAVALLKITSYRDPERRSDAYEVLGQILRYHRLGTSLYPLTSQTVREVQKRLRAGLTDQAPFVRGSAIRGVKIASDVASLPILEELRRSDPYEAAPNKYLIREEAAEAIASIHQRQRGK